MKRRDFLKMLGITSTTAAASSCIEGYHWMGTKSEKLIPFLVPPEDGQIPGESIYLPHTCSECPAQCGAMVRLVVKAPDPIELIKDKKMVTRHLFDFSLYHLDRKVRQAFLQEMSRGILSSTLRAILKKNRISLGTQAEMRVTDPDRKWIIDNKDYWQHQILIQKKNTSLQFYVLTRKDWWAKMEKNWHGQPVKLEGNQHNPINQGKLCIRGQASMGRLYKEDRLKSPRRKVRNQWKEISWKKAFQMISEKLASSKGKNTYLSSRTTGSLSQLIDQFCKAMKVQRLADFEVYSHGALRTAYNQVFGIKDIPLYRLEDSDFLLTLGADLLETFVQPVSYAGQLMEGRKKGFHWTHIEPHLSLTGLKAHQRLTIQPGSEVYLLNYLLREWNKQNKEDSRSPKTVVPPEILSALPPVKKSELYQKTGLSENQVSGILQALKKARRPLILAGGVALAHEAGLETAILSALLQWAMGAGTGEEPLVDFSRSEGYDSVGTLADMKGLSDSLNKGKIGVLFLSKVNPLPHLPSGFDFLEGLKKAHFRVGLGDSLNETLEQCDLVLPLSHSLESFGDSLSRGETWSLNRPVTPERYNTKSEGDILLQLAKQKKANSQLPPTFEEYLYDQWADLSRKSGQVLSGQFWKKAILNLPARKIDMALQADLPAVIKGANFLPTAFEGTTLSVLPSLRTFDGRSSDLPLLSEIPDPLTSVSYGQWVGLSPEATKKLGGRDGSEVLLKWGNRNFTFPIRQVAGLADLMAILPFPGAVDSALEVDMRCGESISLVRMTVGLGDKTVLLPILSGGRDPSGKDILPPSYEEKKLGEGSKRKIEKNSEGGHGAEGRGNYMYSPYEYKDYKWTMAIDLEACTGCSACVAACYVENNIGLSGKEEHLKGREMSWIRLEPYQTEDQGLQFVPMMCQQCDNAPCESVCPVLATVHSSDGLNLQVYNRCVGTRYCSNNCPYKARRFNWFDWLGWPVERKLPDRTLFGGLPLGDTSNPDVSVRMRGVMEKCTFCIQRIRKAKDKAKDEDRKVNDGDQLAPACAQTCPTNAIVFGNILDKKSKVYQLAQSHGAHRVLDHELNTKPSVYYMGKKNHE